MAEEKMGNDSAVRLTFLGTGTSTGIPVIGCRCAVCLSDDPRNQRLRSSIWLQSEEVSLLVDAGPDLRQQALRAKMESVDAVLYTHGHMDHVCGFDELRAYCWHRDSPLPMYANPGCMEILRSMFAWAFAETNVYRGYIKPGPVVVDGPFAIGNWRITPLPVLHGTVETNGYLFERDHCRRLAYIPDVKSVPESTMELLQGVDLLVIDALHHRQHPTHLTVRESLEVIERVAPGESYLIHCSHELDHETLEKSLPPSVRVAYDALTIKL
jgi:phosphoribosyl 1,2-cyclic phosphate phosphodiesterase